MKYQRAVIGIILFGILEVHSKCCVSNLASRDSINKLNDTAFCVFYEQDPYILLNICDDGRHVIDHYCGVGSCNVFGCYCDGGCLVSGSTQPEGNCTEIIKRRQVLTEHILSFRKNKPTPFY